MKVVAFNGSPNKEGNTRKALDVVVAELEQEGICSEVVQVGGHLLRGCTACRACFHNKDRRCAVGSDPMNEFIAKAFDADGILIGSPVYFSNVTTEVKALIDRMGYVSRANGNVLRHKVGAPVVAVRRAGANVVYAAINYLFGISEMIIPCSSYWNHAIGRWPGEIEKDEEGIAALKRLGQNMAFVMKKLGS